MFYAATQLDDEQADPVWELSPDAVKAVLNALRPAEDDVVKFYACKTIENITAQSVIAGEKFATKDCALLLLAIYHAKLSEGFTVVSSVALSHLSKLSPQLFPLVFESVGPSKFL